MKASLFSPPQPYPALKALTLSLALLLTSVSWSQDETPSPQANRTMLLACIKRLEADKAELAQQVKALKNKLRCQGTSKSTSIEATLSHAYDGDTVELIGIGRCRILGIDTPETWKRTKNGKWEKIEKPDPRGVAAHNYLKSLKGKRVRITYGEERQDRYGRHLTHLYLLPDGPDLAGHLLRQGWARPMVIRLASRQATSRDDPSSK